MRTRVKICGLTKVEDALAAAYLGADAIGLVFHPSSPRFVAIEQAAAIASALPAFVTTVALFVDAPGEVISETLRRVKIDALQFHGEERAEDCRRFHKPYLKAVRMRPGTDIGLIAKAYGDACGILLDAYHDGAQGGTGMAFDWSMVPSARSLPIVLAGGLTQDNVEQAITAVRPFAVDVSSGVEADKGVKDADKMAAFIRKTNLATQRLYD